jgi:hypothetical protein
LDHANRAILVKSLSLTAAIVHPDICNGIIDSEDGGRICVIKEFVYLEGPIPGGD